MRQKVEWKNFEKSRNNDENKADLRKIEKEDRVRDIETFKTIKTSEELCIQTSPKINYFAH